MSFRPPQLSVSGTSHAGLCYSMAPPLVGHLSLSAVALDIPLAPCLWVPSCECTPGCSVFHPVGWLGRLKYLLNYSIVTALLEIPQVTLLLHFTSLSLQIPLHFCCHLLHTTISTTILVTQVALSVYYYY